MAVELKSLGELDVDQVAQNLAETVERIQEDNPTLELRHGVFADTLAFYHAVLATQRQEQIKDYLRARSLKELEADPALADSDLVDDVLSNFRMTRKPGTKAQGEITIVIASDITVVVAQNSVWQAKGKRFLATRVFAAKLEAAQINSASDRLLTRTADGKWAFTIIVEAEEEGETGLVKKDTLVVPLTVPNNYVTSFATSDFVEGRTAETNNDLLARLQQGYAAKTMSNRVNMQAMLREIEAFARIVHMSIIGMGDAEMLRDQHWIFPVSGGGRVDWYIRSQEQVLHLKLSKQATLVSKETGYSVWQIAISKNDAPGFYELTNIRLKDAINTQGGFTIESEVRDNDLTGTGFKPDIASVTEGAYSRFQTAILRFQDTVTNVTSLAIGAKQDYDVEAKYMPLIGDIQTTVSSRDIRNHGADCLVKAAVPCFVQLNFTIYKQSGEADPNLSGIRDALCNAINNIDFVGRLYAGQLYDVIYSYLTNNTSVSSMDMLGKIRYPGGSIKYLRSPEVLTVPDDALSMVSPRTVQFFVSTTDIGITVSTAVPLNQ